MLPPRVRILVLLLLSSVHYTLWVNRISSIFVAFSAAIHKIIHGWHDSIVILYFYTWYRLKLSCQIFHFHVCAIPVAMHIIVHGFHCPAFWTQSSQSSGCPLSAFIHKISFHQYAICITTFSLSLTLCCCTLKFSTVETV